MYIQLIRNKPQGNAITGRLVIDGRWFCNTLERVGYQIPALCYHIVVTMSPKFRRLLPLVQNVPRLPIGGTPSNSEASNRAKPVQYPATECRTGIRFHRGSKPEHSTGCVLVVGDNNNNSNVREAIVRPKGDKNINQQHSAGEQHIPAAGSSLSARCVVASANVVNIVVNNKIPVGGRSAAEVEKQLTQLLLKAQQAHEEIILEVIDFRPGTQYGYDTPCPRELQKP